MRVDAAEGGLGGGKDLQFAYPLPGSSGQRVSRAWLLALGQG